MNNRIAGLADEQLTSPAFSSFYLQRNSNNSSKRLNWRDKSAIWLFHGMCWSYSNPLHPTIEQQHELSSKKTDRESHEPQLKINHHYECSGMAWHDKCTSPPPSALCLSLSFIIASKCRPISIRRTYAHQTIAWATFIFLKPILRTNDAYEQRIVYASYVPYSGPCHLARLGVIFIHSTLLFRPELALYGKWYGHSTHADRHQFSGNCHFIVIWRKQVWWKSPHDFGRIEVVRNSINAMSNIWFLSPWQSGSAMCRWSVYDEPLYLRTISPG